MAGQSMMMGDAFGKAYQYGKRKISAMTNEDFNKLTTGDLGREILTDYTAIIPSMTQAIKQSTTFQSFIIHELAEIVKNLPKDLVEGLGIQPTSPQAIVQNYRPPPANQESGLITQKDLLSFLEGLVPSILEASGAHPSTSVSSTTATSSTTGQIAWLKAQLEQAERDKDIHGPTLTPKPTKVQSPQSLVVNADGTVTNVDLRGTTADPRMITLPSAQKFANTPVTKRKAGQSQIMEKKKLEANIRSFQQSLDRYNFDKNGRIQQQKQIDVMKQSLANLLSRYRF